MLLTDSAKRSEQLPTTHNNRRSIFPDRQIPASRAPFIHKHLNPDYTKDIANNRYVIGDKKMNILFRLKF
jgi:hypothetical protein